MFRTVIAAMPLVTVREWLWGQVLLLAGVLWDVARIGLAVALLATWAYLIFS